MKKIQGFLVRHRITILFRSFFRRNRCSTGYRRLDTSPTCTGRTISRLVSWGHQLKTKAKAMCSKNTRLGFKQTGKEQAQEKPAAVPKGHLAVYIGQKDGDFQRVLVPVIYFNHPLFGELLRETEEEYGFNHPGGITIPCQLSEFVSVQTRIKAVRRSRKMLTSRRSS